MRERLGNHRLHAETKYIEEVETMKLSLWITALGLGVISAGATAQSNNITVRLNGERIVFNGVRPRWEGSTALIPLRPVLQHLGGRVSWERDNGTIWATLNNTPIRIYPDKGYALANDRNISLATAPQIINGQTLVPLQFFQEALGMNTQENLETGAIRIDTTAAPGDNQVRVLRRSPGNRISAARRANLDAYNRNRILTNRNYSWYLQQQDYNRYLNERAAWERAYRNYLNSAATPGGVFTGYSTVPTFGPSVLYLYGQDFNLYMANRANWLANYQAYLNLLNQNNGVFPNEALVNEANWQSYLQAREALIQELQNNPPR
jgi:hypothetical protein